MKKILTAALLGAFLVPAAFSQMVCDEMCYFEPEDPVLAVGPEAEYGDVAEYGPEIVKDVIAAQTVQEIKNIAWDVSDKYNSNEAWFNMLVAVTEVEGELEYAACGFDDECGVAEQGKLTLKANAFIWAVAKSQSAQKVDYLFGITLSAKTPEEIAADLNKLVEALPQTVNYDTFKKIMPLVDPGYKNPDNFNYKALQLMTKKMEKDLSLLDARV